MPNAQKPTTELYMPSILERSHCDKHNVPKGIPCFHIPGIRGYKAAICNGRARSAGFVGKISAMSLTGRLKMIKKDKQS